MTEQPYAATAAAKMLADGLRTASQERGLSLREIGRRLNYSQPVVLSHMATGRVPVPIDRALAIAAEVGLPEKEFLLAVLQQRHPDVSWGLVTGSADPVETELEKIAGKPLSALSLGHQRVLRGVVRDSHPEERWLAIPEVAAVRLLRKRFPKLQTEGLDPRDRARLAELLNEVN